MVCTVFPCSDVVPPYVLQLFLASGHGKVEIIKELMSRDVDVNAVIKVCFIFSIKS